MARSVRDLFFFGVIAALTLYSCAGNYPQTPKSVLRADEERQRTLSVALPKYRYDISRILSLRQRDRLGLPENEGEYVLYNQLTSNFSRSESLSILSVLGRHSTSRDDGADYYHLGLLLRPVKAKQGRDEYSYLELDLGYQKALASQFQGVRELNFTLLDFNGDGLDDIFLALRINRQEERYLYYIYTFIGGKIQAILQPWDSFLETENNQEELRGKVTFLRELRSEIFPGFIAEIEVEPSSTISVDLSSMAETLISQGIYSRSGLVLKQQGLPHVDFYPILYPVRYIDGTGSEENFRIRSVQQVGNRYGQLGLILGTWSFQRAGWIPQQIQLVQIN